MRLLIQRVSAASVTIDGRVKSSISQGLLLLVGFEETDEKEDIDFMCKKTIYLRIFDDENGVMNRSVLDIGGEILVVSQFTLFASTKKEIVPHISVLQNPISPFRSTNSFVQPCRKCWENRCKLVNLVQICR